MEIVAGIAGVCAPVVRTLLPAQVALQVTLEKAQHVLQEDVVEVLKLQDHVPVYINEHAQFTDLVRSLGERERMAFIALVKAIYE